MEIKREKYLNEIIERKNNNLIKVITGLRRSGKSYLLNKLYKSYLLEHNILDSQIITFAFDNLENVMKLDKYLPNESTLIYDSKNNYVVNSKKFILYISMTSSSMLNSSFIKILSSLGFFFLYINYFVVS